MLFRQIYFVVDAKEKQIENLSFVAYLNYQLNLFGLVAGPIQHFQQFEEYWREPNPLLEDRHEICHSYLRIGFGGGVNTAQIAVLESYNVFEDLSGTTYLNEYTGMLKNIGNQYFVHVEWFKDILIVTMKPGTYTYRFNKINEVVFNNETTNAATT